MDLPPGCIDEPGFSLQRVEKAVTGHMEGLLRQGYVKTDHVGITGHLLQGSLTDIAFRKVEPVFIIRQDSDIEGGQQLGKSAACVTESYNTYSLAGELRTPVGIPDPFPLFYLFMTDIQLVHQAQQHAQDMLAYGIAVAFRAADTFDPPGGGIFGVDKFHAAAQTADPFKGGRLVKDSTVDLQPGGDDQ